MATKYWLGTADAVAQVDSVGINVFDAATTYGITIGGETVSVAGDTDEETTTDNLVQALNDSTIPYFSAITWARTGSTSKSAVQGTADVAGTPFTFTSFASGGTGTWNAVSNDTVNAGPNVWSTAANWSTGTVPVSTDDVIIRDNNVNICWDIDQNAVALNSLTVDKTYTGKIGLDYKVFATSADAITTVATRQEYRDIYLKLTSTNVDLGKSTSAGTATGSQRICLDLHTGASTIIVHDTANLSSETGRNSVRLKNVNASSELYIRAGTGGVGLAADIAGEVSTVSKVVVETASTATKMEMGSGVTCTSYFQYNGTCNFRGLAATLNTLEVHGGTCNTFGSFLITTVNMYGGTLNPTNVDGSGDCITTLNLFGGTVDMLTSNIDRDITTLSLRSASATIIDEGSIQSTTYTGRISISTTPASS